MDVSQISSLRSYEDLQKTRTPSSEMDKDSFLQILVSQLRNQDPLSPMEDKDFIAQMAQFSVLEQLQTLNAGNTFAQASSLVGKSVYAAFTDEAGMERTIRGIVTSVFSQDSVTYLEVGGYSVPYNQDIVVYDPGSIPDPAL